MVPWVQLEDPPRKRVREILEKITGRAKFLVDESLGEGAAKVIRELGYNVKYGPDVGLGGRSDNEVFAYAWKDGRVILTHDRDFLDDNKFPFTRNPGVVVLPGAHGHDHGLVNALRSVLTFVGHFRNLFPNAKIEISDDVTWTVRYVDKVQGALIRRRLRLMGKEALEWVD